LLFAAALIAGSAAAHGTDPEFVARSSRSLWPEPLGSVAAFDRASRAEILVFAAALAAAIKPDEAALMRQFHIAQADTASVQKVAKRLFGRLLDNYAIARASCDVGDVFCDPIANGDGLSAAGRAIADQLPERMRPWYGEAREFHQTLFADRARRL